MTQFSAVDAERVWHMLSDAAELLAADYPKEAAQLEVLADANYRRYKVMDEEGRARFMAAAFADEAAFQAGRAEARAMFKKEAEKL